MTTQNFPAPTLVQLTQGSAEWHAYRQSRRNASESAAVLGVNPWMTPYQLWLAKTGRAQERVTHAMQRGVQLEPVARAAYEAHTGLVMQPLVLEAGEYSASLDGLTLEGDLLVEIKCPLRGTRSDLWQNVRAGKVPEHYRVQVQHQLMVAGAARAHLWVFDGERGLLTEIERDEAVMGRIRAGWETFAPHLTADTPPPLGDGDAQHRIDAAWLRAAQTFTEARQRADQAAAALEEARKVLLALASHPKEHGAGVTVTRYWKQGSVDYKRIPELQGVDLSRYRKRSTEEARITIAA